MTQLQQKLTLPAAMAEKLEVVRRRTLRVQVGTALVAAVGVLLAAMAVAMLVDWLATLYDFRWRAALTYSAWTAAVATLVAWTLTAWRHTRSVDRMATEVDREIPELQERWSTVTQLSINGHATDHHTTDTHPAMFKQVSSEAQIWTPRIEADRVVPLDGLIRALLLLTAITSVLGFAVLFDSQHTTVLLKRFWRPFEAISATELVDVTNRKVVGRGESLQISANLVGASVEQASLLLEPQTGDHKTISLVPRGDSQDRLTHRLRSIKEPLRYRLRAGDGQTPWYEIVVADRPQLAEVRLQLTPPAYTHKEPKVISRLPRRVTVLEGTHLEILLKPKQSLQSLQLKLGADRIEQLTTDGKGWYRWQTTLTKDLTFQPLLIEEHGLGNLRPPKCEIKCRPDRPPVVKILTPSSEIAVRPDESIPVTFVATDDVGISHAELVVYDEGQQVDGKPVVLDRIPIPLDEQQGAQKVKATVKLDLSKYETTDGSELSFSVRVREDRGQGDSKVEMLEVQGQRQEIADLVAADDTDITQITVQPPATTPESNDLAKQTNEMADTQPSRQTGQQTSANTAPANANAASTNNLAAKKQAAQPQTPTPKSETKDLAAKSAADASAEDTKPSIAKSNPAQPSAEPAKSSESSRKQMSQAEASEQQEMTQDSPPTTSKVERNTVQDAANQSSAEQKPKGQKSTARLSADQKSKISSTSQPQTPQGKTPPELASSPGNPLSRRGLDVESAQSSSSKRMRLKIDTWAGSYDGQQRIKLEIAIAPKLEALDRALEKAESLSRAVLDEVDADADGAKSWASRHNRDIQRADEQIEAAIQVVEGLESETYDTPYAFIGLQLVDISQAHIGPARRDFWKSLQSNDVARIDSVRNGWQHTVRARELLTQLNERFERTKIEYKMADSVAKIKKMYRIFVEDSMALLRPDDDRGSRYRRKVAEFDLDEEDLKRLEEVLEMRNEMRAELARLLADDPRLLRRYLDAQRNRQAVIRNNLDRLIERQGELNRETRAWATVEADQRPKLAKILMGRHIESVQVIAISAAELHDRFETWSPLGKEVEDADFKATSDVLLEIATATRELSTDGLQFVAESIRAKKIANAVATEANEATESTDEESESPEHLFDAAEAAEQISNGAQQLYDLYTQLEVLLRRIGGRQDRLDTAYFATNRLLETRRLIEQTSSWVRQLKQQQAGNYHRSAEVAQYRLAMETDSLAGKLADLESRMAGLLQNEGGMLPQSIAEKARDLLAALDEQAAPNQLAAVYALRRNRMSRATSRQESAQAALELAGKLYDEMIEAAIIELDKLPVRDPIASLLDDPTLDELLRELEQELPINEALGIPRRPSNLQIMSDWMRPGGDNAIMTGGGRRMLLNQMRQQQLRRQRQLDRAYQRAVARALKEAEADDLVKDMPRLARETTNWNRLASQLDDDLRQGRDKAPPERYRRAIEQYFRQVSGADKGTE